MQRRNVSIASQRGMGGLKFICNIFPFRKINLVAKVKYNAIVSERHWPHSKKVLISIDDRAPLILN